MSGRNPFQTLTKHEEGNFYYYSLPELEKKGFSKIKRLPISVRIMLESLLRNCDGKLITEDDIKRLANWNPVNPKEGGDVPFVVSRVILQDFTGVPLVVDLAAMRDAVAERNGNPGIIEPLVPVDLVVDHSVQVDRAGTADAFVFNLGIEFQRNIERYSFLKWGQQAFKTFRVVPPGIGIVHQVNLENIATVATSREIEGKKIALFDTLVGTDSHTTMINGLGVLGWGVGGIEAEAAMLGQPVFLQAPEVIGVHMSGKLQEGVTATDLTLFVTELLRKEKVVDKFVEFFGEGVENLTVADRATIGNMAPEYGATIGFFPADEQTLDYLRLTGRDEKHVQFVKQFLIAQNMFGIPKKGEVDFTKVLEVDLSTIQPAVSGPKRPQDRINLGELKDRFLRLLIAPVNEGGYGMKIEEMPQVCVLSPGNFNIMHHHDTGGKTSLGKPMTWSETEMVVNRPYTEAVTTPGYTDTVKGEVNLTHGTVVIAAITSCTNTSNPSVMLASGLLAKKAVEKGLTVNPCVKTSLAPGSRVVTDYLEKADLQKYLDKLGFQLVAYGCTTCIGNSGPLDEEIEDCIKNNNLVVASVLSGNRNFEARINSAVKANFLMSPPLVVAFALAGRVDIDLEKEPLGKDKDGHPVYLKDIWPSDQEIREAMQKGIEPSMFKKRYSNIEKDSQFWEEVQTETGAVYPWNPMSTYIQDPPYFEESGQATSSEKFKNMRVLALFGDSVTTDHISPAGAFKPDSPAGQYLISLGVKQQDFNSYGSRRGNHHVMMRGTFANVRLRNLLADGKEGGYTKIMPDGVLSTIFDASKIYRERNVPLIIFAGRDYGMGSSRDWAAKGTALLGVKVVVARSFERIHRSNLIGMGVLPLEFINDESYESLGIKGDETFTLLDLEKLDKPKQQFRLRIEKDGKTREITLQSRLDTESDIEYYKEGGILPYVLNSIMAKHR